MLLAKNESHRIKKELKALRNENKPLLKLMLDLYHYVEDTFDKDVVITMIYRTSAEQDYLYRNSARYKKRKFKSPHQFYHAIDIRSSIYTKEERIAITSYLNSKYDSNNYYNWTAKVHEVGDNGLHFHIQFCKQ